MSNASLDETSASESVTPINGTSPYAEGGGGVTFERKVVVQYLAHLLASDGAPELGDGRQVTSVALQQAPVHPIDDLVVRAARADESEPSLVLAIAARRSPRLVQSDDETRKLFRRFVRALIDALAAGTEHRLCLVVAGKQRQAEQLATLADHAKVQNDSPAFFELVRTPRKFNAGVRGRLDHVEKLVKHGLQHVSDARANSALVRQRTWQLLARLDVRMPRLESPDESDWAAVANSLIPVARGSDLGGALQLRDRLTVLASEYAPRSARIDLTILRRDTHTLLDAAKRRHRRGWQMLDHLHHSALALVRDEIIGNDSARRVRLDRSEGSAELAKRVAGAAGVLVTGESGVGKSALALLGLAASEITDPESGQVLCINLRHVPRRSVEFEATLGTQLSTLLNELSAPGRILVIDGADAVVEGWGDAFQHLIAAAHQSDVKAVAVTSIDAKQVVKDAMDLRFGTEVEEHAVAPLTDAEIAEIVETFIELKRLNASPRSRELLRRLVVVDLLVRGRVRDIPLCDADAMREVWSGLVRRREVSDRGSPEAREVVLLRLAALALGVVAESERLSVISEFEPTAVAGLRHDGLLGRPDDSPFTIGPEFAHDEVRRYAVARVLLGERLPDSQILASGAPRWALSAARLACQVLLAEPDTPATPMRGRFAKLQASFDGLVEAGHGARWGDVPAEALITLGSPGAVLRDAWPGLLAEEGAGLRRFARLVDQRLRDDSGFVDIDAVEPIITLMLEARAPWRFGTHAEGLLRSWLRAHSVANTRAGNPLRMLLRDRLIETCAAADRRLAKEKAAEAAVRAARTPEEIEQERQFEKKHAWAFSNIGYGGRRTRQRPEVPREITDSIVLELLALLGPDLGDDGEAILRRVAANAPHWLAPAVEQLLTGRSLATYGQGLLARLTEAYYLDDEADSFDWHRYGIRGHEVRDVWGPLAAWYFGPFVALFQSDFRSGVAVLNRLLNHAASTRAGVLARNARRDQTPKDVDISPWETELNIAGTRQVYVGDGHVWLWYRGTGVGPYPCFSALQALERACDQMIKARIPVGTLVSVLLHECKNIAMVSLVVGLLVRHLEQAGELLDPYLVEPQVWNLEFNRVVNESAGFAASSEGLVAPERRNWSLREAAAFLVLRADDKRAARLRVLGETLVQNTRRYLEGERSAKTAATRREVEEVIERELIPVRGWASTLDRDSYRAYEADGRVLVQAIPPEDVSRALQETNEDLGRTKEALRLFLRYDKRHGTGSSEAIPPEELVADTTSARDLLERPPSSSAQDPWDTAALVAATALEEHFENGAVVPDDALSFCADTLLRIGEGAVWPRPYEFEATYFERGADRSAARAVPLLLLPQAERLRATLDKRDARTTVERVVRAGFSFSCAVADEVRLYLARGLDHVWNTPCTGDTRCHHEVAWQLAMNTIRDCILGPWTPESGRDVLALKEPFAESLARAEDDSIILSRLDPAIRALAPASVADTCASTRARTLLNALFGAQRRSLLRLEGHSADTRGTHTLVSARALLTLAQDSDDKEIYAFIDAYAQHAVLLGKFLEALSAAAEEAPSRAAAARRIWPSVVRYVLDRVDSRHARSERHDYRDQALATLLPNSTSEVSYLYREMLGNPIVWWEPLALKPEVEAWLVQAAGIPNCVDQLIIFLGPLPPEEQSRVGLPWIRALVLPDPARIAGRSFMLSTWLKDGRSAAVAAGLSACWQEVVDALVVAGVTLLAPYSD